MRGIYEVDIIPHEKVTWDQHAVPYYDSDGRQDGMLLSEQFPVFDEDEEPIVSIRVEAAYESEAVSKVFELIDAGLAPDGFVRDDNVYYVGDKE